MFPTTSSLVSGLAFARLTTMDCLARLSAQAALLSDYGEEGQAYDYMMKHLGK